MNRLSIHQVQTLPATVDLMTAASAFGIGRTKTYELARDGGFPYRIVRVGASYHVPTADATLRRGVSSGSVLRPDACGTAEA